MSNQMMNNMGMDMFAATCGAGPSSGMVSNSQGIGQSNQMNMTTHAAMMAQQQQQQQMSHIHWQQHLQQRQQQMQPPPQQGNIGQTSMLVFIF
jgi:hypothetical protein